MYNVMDTDFYGSAMFYLVAIIVLNFWLMNLLIAVVVNVFQDIRAETKRSAFGADEKIIVEPQWAIDTKKRWEPSRMLKLYLKTELFWVLLIVVDLISQAFKQHDSSPRVLKLLREYRILIRVLTTQATWREALPSSGCLRCVFVSSRTGPTGVSSSVSPATTSISSSHSGAASSRFRLSATQAFTHGSPCSNSSVGTV